MTAGPLLEIDRLTAGYDGAAVIRDIRVTVAPGEIVALLGPNGAGKTTTLRAVCNIVRPMAGAVRLAGIENARASPQALTRRGLGHVPEGRGVFYGLTVAEHFRLPFNGRKLDPSVAYGYFPALAEMTDRRAGLLSGGEQQMLSLACVLVRRPRILLVDELSLGLAPVLVERLLPIVRRYASDTGAGVLLVEQHVQLALEVADRAYVMSHGEIVLEHSAQDLRGDRSLLVASYLGEAAGNA